MKKLYIILLINLCNILNAQYSIEKIKSKDGDTFPQIITSNQNIERTINQYLHATFLDNVYQSSKNPFQNIIKADGTRKYYFHDYEVDKNTIPVLSLSILAEYCGAYCEEAYQYINFDLSTGYVITVNDLINHKKSESLTQLINDKIKKEITTFLNQIPNKNLVNKEDSEYYNDQREIYEECLSNVDIYKLNNNSFDFYIKNDSIYFQRGRCSNHALRALDELSNFTVGFDKNEIIPYLSEYGRNLYQNLPRKMTDIKEKVFTGKVGNYPIKGIINKDNFGFYWYEKTKKLIQIDYNDENQVIIINEHDDDYNSTATFQLTQENNQLIGTWNKTNSKTSLPVVIQFNL